MRRVSYAEPARRKASPGGEAGSPQGLTDEVEAIDYHHRLVRHCSLRPHPVRLGPDHHSRGMTATGSHIDFGFAARSTTPQGKALAGATLIAPAAPHPSALTGSHLPPGEGYFSPRRNFSRGMTATGSHIDFGFAARGTTPKGRLFSVPAGFFVDSYRSIFATWRARRAPPARSEPSLPATHITASRRYLLFASAGPHGGGPRRAAGGSRKRRNYCPR